MTSIYLRKSIYTLGGTLLLKQLKLERVMIVHDLKHLDHLCLAIKMKYSSYIFEQHLVCLLYLP